MLTLCLSPVLLAPLSLHAQSNKSMSHPFKVAQLVSGRRCARKRVLPNRRTRRGFCDHEIQRLVRATLRGIQYSKSNKRQSVRMIAKWAELDQPLAEGSYDMVQPARKAFKSRWMKSKPTRNSTCHRIRRRPSNGVSWRSKTRLVRSVFL